jgi:hypothetical protein
MSIAVQDLFQEDKDGSIILNLSNRVLNTKYNIIFNDYDPPDPTNK